MKKNIDINIGYAHKYFGKLIVYEGIDGTGKSTIAYEMKHLFPKTILLKEPTKPGLKTVKDFADDRVYNIEKNILPALRQGYIINLDRYFYSNIAYQGVSENIDYILEKNKEVVKPDIVFLFYLPIDVALERIYARKQIKQIKQIKQRKHSLCDYYIYENKSYLTKVDNIYKSMYADNIIRINAYRPLKEIILEVSKIIAKKLNFY